MSSFNTPLKVMCFTQDSSFSSYSSDMLNRLQETEETTYMGYFASYFTSYQSVGDVPNFLIDLGIKVASYDPDVIFIASQNMDKSDKLHSDALPSMMETHGYRLLKRERYNELNSQNSYSTYKPICCLRSSIYVKAEMVEPIKEKETFHRNKIGNDFQICSYGGSYFYTESLAIVSYVLFPNRPLMAFVNCKLPFNPNSMSEYRKTGEGFSRMKDLQKTTSAFNDFYHQFVCASNPMSKDDLPPNIEDPFKPKVAFFAGDLNFRVLYSDQLKSTMERSMSEYKHQALASDELRMAIRERMIPEMSEGKSNRGPDFYPVSDLRPGRKARDVTANAYDCGKDGSNLPCWSERILYKSTCEGVRITCSSYNRFDRGSITKSKQSAVIGTYNVS